MVKKIHPIKVSEVISNFKIYLDKSVSLRGRILTKRRMKNYTFFDLMDKEYPIQLISADNLDICPGDLVEIVGTCSYSKTKEPSVKIDQITIISRWEASKGIKTIKYTKKHSPLKAFKFESYKLNLISYLVRKYLKGYLNKEDFLEVQTPILCKRYNGGKSFPVKSTYLTNFLGYNRTTFEEKMQALVGMGFDKIYQVGSIFRSQNEYTFLEVYSSFTEFNKGKEMVKNLLKYVIDNLKRSDPSLTNEITISLSKKDWKDVDFFEELQNLVEEDISKIRTDGRKILKLLANKKIITSKDTSLETLADVICRITAKKYQGLLFINNLPVWSSPLYKKKDDFTLYRTRGFLPNQKGSFELGLQENNYDEFIDREKEQKKDWKTKYINDQDLAEVISGGLPPMFGFAINPERISKIFYPQATIDPFFEN